MEVKMYIALFDLGLFNVWITHKNYFIWFRMNDLNESIILTDIKKKRNWPQIKKK